MATPPKRLSQRHVVAASMLAAGARRREVARTLRVNPSSVSHWGRSQAFAEAVARFQRRWGDAFLAAGVDRLLGPPRPCPHCGRAARSRRAPSTARGDAPQVSSACGRCP